MLNLKVLSFFLFLFCGSTLWSQSTFYKNYLKEVDNRQVFNITPTTDGGYAMIGITATENASDEVGITKLDCTGEVSWAKKFGISGTINNVFGKVIEADNGDLVFAYSVGTFQNYDILLSRVSSADGTIVWSKRLGGSRDDQARDIVQTIDGNFVLVGGTSSYGTGSSGQVAYTDVYLLKVDGDGNLLWTKTFGEGGQIDAGYAIREDASGNLLLTGRYLVGGTFYAFLMKTEGDGTPIFFKGYGQPNHRTYGYDLEITSDNHYVLTGSTTIDKIDFSSYADAFLIKTDTEGDTLFTRIYYPWVGQDRSESGSSIVLQEDGGYGIGVPTLSFTNHTVGFVPNKNAVYSTNSGGTLQKAYLYNQGGSHYTQLRKALNGGFILSNFSNFFSPTFEFLPLVVRAKEDYLCGCNEIDVTGEVSTALHPWDVQDITNYTESQGSTTNTITGGADFDYSSIDVQCEAFPELVCDFYYSGFCVGEEVVFTDESSDFTIQWDWEFGDSNISATQNPVHVYTEPGTYNVQLMITDGCSVDSASGIVEILPLDVIQADTSICEGEMVFLAGAFQTEAGIYLDTIPAQDTMSCKRILETELIISGEIDLIQQDTTICSTDSIFLAGAFQMEAGIYIDTLPPVDEMSCKRIVETTLSIGECNCDPEFPKAFTPNGDNVSDVFGVVSNCENQITDYSLKIFNRWGKIVFESSDLNAFWDGSYGSEKSPADIYFYTVTYNIMVNNVMESRSEHNDLTLIR
jgi:gliding motility-associated-like protein